MCTGGDPIKSPPCVRRGDWVTVRDLPEIIATLDAQATLDGLPFMPEMARYCGQTFRVHRRADRTCVEGFGLRALSDTVFLEGLRCDGVNHDHCQRRCLIFWKEAWLKEPSETAIESPKSQIPNQHIRAEPLPTTRGGRYFCQSTELARATREFSPKPLQNCLADIRLGELTPWRFAHMIWISLTNRVRRLIHGHAFSHILGEESNTPAEELNLQAGEAIEVKSLADIKATLDANGRNRGLAFEAEMALHCGRRYRVGEVIRTIISEETGKMINIANTVTLEGLVCQGLCDLNCPRANYYFWREIWLRRV